MVTGRSLTTGTDKNVYPTAPISARVGLKAQPLGGGVLLISIVYKQLNMLDLKLLNIATALPKGGAMLPKPSTYDVLRRHGVDRRTFLKFCTTTAAAMGLEAAMVPKVVEAMETKPRIPVIWLHGLECTCCSESFIRSSHPIAQDVVLNMISLDYDDTLQAAAGFQVEEIRKRIMKEHPGEYILAVEGNAPTKDGGVYCTVGGESFLDILQETAEDAKAIVAWGSCASNGCVQAAHPNPTGAKPVHELIPHRAIINVPGCPPIAEVMTGVLTYILTFGAAARARPLRPPQDVSTASASMTSATAGPSSTPASSSRPGTTMARARAGAFTRWAAAAR